MWQLTEPDLEAIAIGAGILGTGGGGNPYVGRLRARQAMREHGPVSVLDPDEVPEDARVVCVGGIGAPTVGIEKMRDYQAYHALRALEDFTGVKATALISNEIGGSNSLEPLIPASITGLPVVDADGMGRAFPELQMKTFYTYGVPPTPLALADEKGEHGHHPPRHRRRVGGATGTRHDDPDGLRGLLRRGAHDRRAGPAHGSASHAHAGP